MPDHSDLIAKLKTAKEAPKLPAEMSPDGREVWDWADRFSRHVHRANEIARLRREIGETGTECGDCDKWMKSRECPRERNVNGQTRGPSWGAPICGQFVEAASAAKRRNRLQAELTALQPQPQSPTEPRVDSHADRRGG